MGYVPFMKKSGVFVGIERWTSVRWYLPRVPQRSRNIDVRCCKRRWHWIVWRRQLRSSLRNSLRKWWSCVQLWGESRSLFVGTDIQDLRFVTGALGWEGAIWLQLTIQTDVFDVCIHVWPKEPLTGVWLHYWDALMTRWSSCRMSRQGISVSIVCWWILRFVMYRVLFEVARNHVRLSGCSFILREAFFD